MSADFRNENQPFDTIVMVDWSGVPDRGPVPKPNAIWAAALRGDRVEAPRYLRSIAVAEAWLIDLVHAETLAGRRAMIGLDVPFGYPAEAGRTLTGSGDPRALWALLAEGLAALGPGETRFDLAARLNARFAGDGPFWFNGHPEREIAGLSRTKPPLPPGLSDRRLVERLAKGSFSCWQMGGNGAVGSQAVTGMATLHRLSQTFPDELSVWPFDPPRAVQLVEIWPSLFADRAARLLEERDDLPRHGRDRAPIKDAAQVLAMVELMKEAQEDGRLRRWLDAPPEEARRSEGWILGVERATPLAPPPLSDDCFALPPGVAWTPVDVALGLLRERLGPVTGTEVVPLDRSDGRILASDVAAPRANPPGANAAVDGYGFAHAATGVGPQTLPLLAGRAAAGVPFGGAVPPGAALRILTGALLPAGVDTVVLEEDTRSDDGWVAFNGPVRAGANTRRAGEDIGAGALALPDGHVMRPPDLALLAATGVDRVAVRRRLRVGVLSTGDEIVAPGSDPDPSRTYDANRPMLLALARRWGHEAVDLGHVPDDRQRLRAALDGAQAEVILTSGGASAGEEDHVSALMRDEGTLASWRIALKPGRPLALGMRRGVPVFGLPGNPVASLVCALVFARPALSLMAGGPWPEPLAMTVPAAFEKRKKPGRREYLRARLGPDGAEAFRSEGSGRISGLSWAGGLVELADGAAHVRPGDPVRFLPYAGFGLG
ncbi:gephyrin-like molybdotransferase Glp [Palleronia rufa]|uniref:molybdopterin-binding protein n=1 Tax=Palleronia rufa TaxID=1530186 RepID=UPI000B15104E